MSGEIIKLPLEPQAAQTNSLRISNFKCSQEKSVFVLPSGVSFAWRAFESKYIASHMIGVRLQSQSTSKKHNQVKKKPWYLCALQKKSQKYFGYACLIIIRFVILTIEQTKPFACSRCVICVSWSRRTARAKDHSRNIRSRDVHCPLYSVQYWNSKSRAN